VKQFRPKVRKRGTEIARPAAPDTMIGPGYVELLGCQFGPTVPDQELIEFYLLTHFDFIHFDFQRLIQILFIPRPEKV